MRLNLGCGGKKLPDYVNVDCESDVAPDFLVDLGRERWPWLDNSVEEANASHILEHLPGETFFHFLRELYRVCVNGAVIHVALPHPRHDLFLNDPTHCRPVTPGTLIMFSKEHLEMMARKKMYLTPFWRIHKVDFYLEPKIFYKFDPAVNPKEHTEDELAYRIQHQSNIVMEWNGRMICRK